MAGAATFSDDGRYRYTLSRDWSGYGVGTCVFVMLNPSTATADVLDPTVTRCLRYATRWGFARLEVLNVFALRSTDPRQLYVVDDPVGPQNNQAIQAIASRASLLVCAWGTHGTLRDRDRAVLSLLMGRSLFCLGVNRDGTPKHPLYLRGNLLPVPYPGR